MKRSVHAAGKRYTASAELRNRIQKTISAKPRREAGWLWKILAVPALSLLILSVAVGFYARHEADRRQRVYSELTDLHVAALASPAQVDVVSTDRHTVKPWFQGKIPFHLQSARATRIIVYPARRTRHLSRTNARAHISSTRCGSMKFRFSSFKIAERKPRVCPQARCTRNRSPFRTGRKTDFVIL